MAAPLITAITTVPNRENATNQASFSNDVDTFFGEVNGFQTQANTQAQYLDGLAAEVDADAATALSAKNSAVAAANYKGDWTVSSDVKQGESYSYLGQVWIAKQDSLNVTPAEGAFWIEGFGDAVNVRYDNTASGLAATDVQGAIDEVEGRVDTAEADILTNQSYVGGQTIATGSAVFDNADNSIALAAVGVGVEIGDVIQISGAANTKNNSEFTIEVITDDNNVIVNQAHAGGTTSKALVSETATITVKILCKWYLAPIGLGQGWANVTRIASTAYQNNTNRPIKFSVYIQASAGNAVIAVDNSQAFVTASNFIGTMQQIIPINATYNFSGTTQTFSSRELR